VGVVSAPYRADAEPVAQPIWRCELPLPDCLASLDLDVDPTDERSAIDELIAAHLVRLGATGDGTLRDELVGRAVKTRDTARRHDAIGAAMAADLVDGVAVEAYLLMFCALGGDGRPALDSLARSLLGASTRRVGHRTAGVIELGGRPTVRGTGFALVTPDADTSAIVAEHTYVVPIAGTGTQLVLLCWTPHVDAADEIGGLFDAIAAGVTVS
jgi:hypothetical protein